MTAPGTGTTGPERIVVLDGARVPTGSFGGMYRTVEAATLGGAAATEALARAQVQPDDIDEVVMGCIGQWGPDAYNARRVAMAAGLPDRVPAYTVNRLCGSGLQAVWSAAMQMRWGGADIALAGGDESMSRMPYYDVDARAGDRLGDRRLVDGTVCMLTDPFDHVHMGVTAENVARRYEVSREAQDEFALTSQQRAASHAARAAFADEIVPFRVDGRRPRVVDEDEHPRPETTAEGLAGLRPVFESGGTVTAGNSSGINDGAAALVLARASVAEERGLAGLVTLEAVATAAMEPALMGYAPVRALERLFRETGTRPADIDIIELNEAFAAQAVAVIRDAGLDPVRTNPYGGAIALGHPGGRDRRDPHPSRREAPRPRGRRARSGDHVHRGWPGAGGVVPAVLTPGRGVRHDRRCRRAAALRHSRTEAPRDRAGAGNRRALRHPASAGVDHPGQAKSAPMSAATSLSRREMVDTSFIAIRPTGPDTDMATGAGAPGTATATHRTPRSCSSSSTA